MADIEDDDDEFGSDDAFDDLPPNTLLELEQQASQYIHQIPRLPVGGVTSATSRLPASQSQWQTRKQESWQSERTVQPADDSQDYRYEDEDIVDLDQDPYTLPQQYDQGPTFAGSLQLGAPPDGSYVHVQAAHDAAAPNVSVAELQARILQLENDRSDLQKQVEEARGAAQSKAGEAAILRQKAEKSAREHEQKVASLRLQHAEERQKQLAELERMKSEKEKLTTNARFLEHDLAFETGKLRQLQRTQRQPSSTTAGTERPIQAPAHRQSPAVTPRKGKVLPYRDGFDDSDLVMLSPSKPKDRSKQTTPSKIGAKRKRTATTGNEFPAPALSPPPQLPLSEPKSLPYRPTSGAETKASAELLYRLGQEQSKLRFMQKLQQHQVTEDLRENIFEALARFALPLAPDRKLSTILYERLSLSYDPPIGGTSSAGATTFKFSESKANVVADRFTDIILALWDQCLAESYYPPIPCIVSTLVRIFELERFVFVRKYIARAAPLAIATADLVAVPLARERAAKGATSASAASDSKNQSGGARANTTSRSSISLRQHQDDNGMLNPGIEFADAANACVEVLPCLQILVQLAEAARMDREAIRLFWKQVKFDFMLMFLMNGVVVEEMRAVLELLRLSVLPTSFGAITESAISEGGGGGGGNGDLARERQERREVDTLDRLTVLLGEQFDVSREDVDEFVVWDVRDAIVDVLYALVFKDHGANLLAHHRHAIGRLFRHLYSAITALYSCPPPSGSHTIITSTINKTMTILYRLCSPSSSSALPTVDVRQKLAAVQGGMHLHLLSLTRLAFAERIWFERGIEEGTVERAHGMLDEWLSPEEGEGLMMMFGSSEGGSEGA